MVKKIQLVTTLPSKWVEAQKEKHLDGRHYTTLIAGKSTDVYKPDGSPLLLFRAGVIPDAVCEAARPALRRAGQASGSHRGYQSNVIGNYDLPDCRKTYFSANHVDEWLRCQPFIRECNTVFQRHLRSRYSVQRKLTARTAPIGWNIGQTAFTTMTVNLWNDKYDAQTPVHVDKGDLQEGFGVISVLSSGNYTGGYLIFPAYQVAVDMRTTDVLLCDVHEYHANAPIDRKPPGWERIACVLYYRTMMQNEKKENEMSVVRFPVWGQLPEYDNLCAVLLANARDVLGRPHFWSLEKDEHRVALLVTSKSGVSLDRWDNLTLPERIPYLEAAIETYAPKEGGEPEQQADPREPEWTEVKSPTEFQKEFGISSSTWRRRINDETLVIDRVSSKAVRVRKDCYLKFLRLPK